MEKNHNKLVRLKEEKGLKVIFQPLSAVSAALFFMACFSCLAEFFMPSLLSHSESLLPLAWKVWLSERGQLAAKCSWMSSFLMNKPAHSGYLV